MMRLLFRAKRGEFFVLIRAKIFFYQYFFKKQPAQKLEVRKKTKWSAQTLEVRAAEKKSKTVAKKKS